MAETKAGHEHKPLGPLFGGTEEGYYTEVVLRSEIPIYSTIFFIIGISWTIVNLPELKEVAVFYAIIMAFVAVVSSSEYNYVVLKNLYKKVGKKVPQEFYPWFANIGLGAGEKKKALLGGVIYGGVFVVISSFISSFVGQNILFSSQALASAQSGLKATLSAVFFTGLVAPYVENTFFAQEIAPTVAEDLGVVPAMVIGASSFGLFHFIAYGGVLLLMFSAILYMSGAIFGTLYFRNGLFGLISHLIINFAAISFSLAGKVKIGAILSLLPNTYIILTMLAVAVVVLFLMLKKTYEKKKELIEQKQRTR